ncbi:MAG: flagellin [Gammaproteobacteria bacterium]|nr:flagellin [Gammaproteobacteria bacterium]
MAQIINTNVSSLTAQRNLNKSQSSLATSMQRLSSGLRINSAKDDAAGLAISERMTSQIRGLNQAIRNANDGISFAQTAEGALSTAGDALQRIRELAVQSANDTNTDSDRASLQDEVNQLIAEVDRIANNTQFNGQNVLDGSISTLLFQVGSNANQTISVSGVDSRSSELGANATVTSTGVTLANSVASTTGYTAPGASSFSINGQLITTTTDGVSVHDGDSSAKALAVGINAKSSITGVSAVANATTVNLGTMIADADGLASGEFTINGINVISGATQAGDADSTLQDAINAVSNQTGVTASLDSSSKMVLTASDGRNISVGGDGNNTTDIFSEANADLTGAVDEVIVGTITMDSDNAIVVDTGLAAVTNGMLITAATTNVTTTNSVSNLDISSQSGANSAITNVDRALDTVNSLRSTFGATQTRFESAIANLSVTSENLSAARSRIRDADFAMETAEMTRSQILQQAGVAMVSQANSLPQSVLSLLQ